MQSVVFGDVNAATARVLAADGFDVHVPRAQGCCGALHATPAAREEGVARAHGSSESSAGYDYIVTNAAGCGSHLKDHGLANAVDVSELLATPSARPRAPPARAAGSPSRTPATCGTRSGSRVEPRAALDAIPGLDRARARRAGDLLRQRRALQPRPARGRARARHAARRGHVLATGRDAYASANPGCLVQVTAALRRAGGPLPAFHPIELVDASIRGVAATDLLEAARR